MIGLAEGHPICQEREGEALPVVDFSAGGKNVVTENQVSGKRKKGGISFDSKDSLVCTITLGESSYPVRAVIPGQLLEANDRLEKEPELLFSEPDRAGFICIIMPRGGDKYFPERVQQGTMGDLVELDEYNPACS